MTVNEYIEKNLPLTLRSCPCDDPPFFALPKPYNVPCASGMFQEMYYWDTYFTNIGHIIDGNLLQAKNNVDNLIAMASRFGFVLNGNRVEFLNNSQPPFMSQAVREIYDKTKDKEWLESAYDAILREYTFYTEERGTSLGLSHYDAHTPISDAQVKRGAELMIERMGYRPDLSDYDLARGLYAVGESGWDVNPRMTYRAYEIIPVDLNSIIYSIERNMAYFASELKRGESEIWERRAKKRSSLMREHMISESGLFSDYDLSEKKRTDTVSAACFYPLYFGLASREEAEAVRNIALDILETDHGIVACQRMDDVKGSFQWGYPNGWPPIQIIAVGGLHRYGYKEEAERIAEKFLRLIENCFSDTGHLWEKYDVVNGNANALEEYETPPMLGWTYGAYRYLTSVLNNKKDN